LAWIMDGKYRPLPFFRWIEARLNSGPQNWKQYTASLLLFNTVLFVFEFVVLFLQPWMPLNGLGRGMLAPTTIFHSVVSFMTNTD
jgi:K+-transporting ATPase ATPase A chain